MKKIKIADIIILIILFILPTLSCAVEFPALSDNSLPPPITVNMTIDKAIQYRTSIREFTNESIGDEELSTILWSAYGLRRDGNRTVPAINEKHGVKIYVLKEEAVYLYDYINHSLVFYKDGDYRYIGQYDAPIQLGLIWDKKQNSNENFVGAEMGEIGQNIYFMSSALEIGTVATAEVPSPLSEIGLPSYEEGKIVMPIGYPTQPANFLFFPMWFSFLPRVRDSGVTLSTVLEERTQNTVFTNEKINRKMLSQLLWSSYGYSYFLDRSDFELDYIERHRAVPSAHGYYPLRIYAVSEKGIFRYIPGLYSSDTIGLPIVTYFLRIRTGDFREELSESTASFTADAPLSIVSVLNLKKANRTDDLSGEELRWIWNYEAGACAQNALLDATAWGLCGDIVPVNDIEPILSLLRLNKNFIPLYAVSVGYSI